MSTDPESGPPAVDQPGPEKQQNRARAEAAAYYVWPLVWVGEWPDNLHVSVPPGEMPPDLDLAQLKEVVFEVDLPQKLRARAYRDGMFLFDFSSWAPIAPDPTPLANFFETANLVLRRVALMNAHVACLHTALCRRQAVAHGVTSLSPSEILPVNSFEDPDDGIALPDPRIAQILYARYVSTYSPYTPMLMDWRLGRRTLVDKGTAEESFRLLDGLLSHAASEQVLALADLLVRSAAAYGDYDHSQALITAWAIIESLLQELWERYVEEHRQREMNGTLVPFINVERKKRLTEGRELTASLISEILSLLDRLPFDLYRDVSEVRVSRNKWIHDLHPVNADTAALALTVAEEMLRLVQEVDLSLSQGLSMQI